MWTTYTLFSSDRVQLMKAMSIEQSFKIHENTKVYFPKIVIELTSLIPVVRLGEHKVMIAMLGFQRKIGHI